MLTNLIMKAADFIFFFSEGQAKTSMNFKAMMHMSLIIFLRNWFIHLVLLHGKTVYKQRHEEGDMANNHARKLLRNVKEKPGKLFLFLYTLIPMHNYFTLWLIVLPVFINCLLILNCFAVLEGSTDIII